MTSTVWEPVIGIEVHVELKTASKMFCSCAVGFGEEPNTNVCPTCLGLPGALPVINATAIEWITKIGLAFHCEISPRSVFHRKNYFYADLPKNYQISQFDLPICSDGWLDVEVEGEEFRVGIERAHMEEDTGKSLHEGLGGRIHSATSTLLDFNRSGVPLVEVVSRPDIRSAPQARAYAQELRAVVAELDVSDARMEEGSIRFDANVSVRPIGTTELGTKVEIKNMNSFRSLERAVASEITRQISAIEAGERIVQETRHWDEEAGMTQSMRSKEGSSDYRYFIEPDLVPVEISAELLNQVQSAMPELPADRRRRYAGLGLDAHAVAVLSSAEPSLRHLFKETVELGTDAPTTANWVTGELTAALRRTGSSVAETPLTAGHLAELVGMITEGKLSSSAGKEVLGAVLAGQGSPAEAAAVLDLLQVSDQGLIAAAVDEVLAVNPDAIVRFRSGEEKVLGFLVGLVMRSTGGKADPKLVNQLLRTKLSA
ncbi:MAG TPA: Asp-tRNA(Asn)/Glu-tRNA(Gln) amidotransferase subunit GatB [Acidimicrobiia bacterium]|nr:Asp-tRNA(Asn)/Glu-tRNA(Gln) amidotransferase subunit GatB [Acidimicrobiia bacterium]